jgi:hypothetical protein
LVRGLDLLMDLDSLKIKPFEIVVQFAATPYTLQVEQTYLSANKEVFTIIDGNESFQVTSNRPLIKANSNSRKKPNYKAVDARIGQLSFFERVINAIQEHIRSIERPPFKWS